MKPSAAPGSPLVSPDTTAPSVPVFDRQVLCDMFGQESGVIGAVLQTFVASMTTSMAELRVALAARDLVAAVGLAHRIKGAARMSGALALAQAALGLEHPAQKGDWRATRRAAAELESQWQLVRLDPALDAACNARIGDHARP